MSLWQYKGPRKNIRGRWYYDGRIIENPTRPTKDFFPVSKTETTKPIPELKNEEEELRKKLSDMKMKELRKIGKKYNVNDNDKSELVDEIIEAKKANKEI